MGFSWGTINPFCVRCLFIRRTKLLYRASRFDEIDNADVCKFAHQRTRTDERGRYEIGLETFIQHNFDESLQRQLELEKLS